MVWDLNLRTFVIFFLYLALCNNGLLFLGLVMNNFLFHSCLFNWFFRLFLSFLNTLCWLFLFRMILFFLLLLLVLFLLLLFYLCLYFYVCLFFLNFLFLLLNFFIFIITVNILVIFIGNDWLVLVRGGSGSGGLIIIFFLGFSALLNMSIVLVRCIFYGILLLVSIGLICKVFILFRLYNL